MIIRQLIMQTQLLITLPDDDAVTIFDLSLDEDGSAISSNGYNATFRATGASFNINGTPTANTDTTYHGAATMQESTIGGSSFTSNNVFWPGVCFNSPHFCSKHRNNLLMVMHQKRLVQIQYLLILQTPLQIHLLQIL